MFGDWSVVYSFLTFQRMICFSVPLSLIGPIIISVLYVWIVLNCMASRGLRCYCTPLIYFWHEWNCVTVVLRKVPAIWKRRIWYVFTARFYLSAVLLRQVGLSRPSMTQSYCDHRLEYYIDGSTPQGTSPNFSRNTVWVQSEHLRLISREIIFKVFQRMWR